jgi:hypothetical protein
MYKYFFKLLLPAFFYVFFISGCVVKVASPSDTRIEGLSHILYSLDTSIPKEETLALSKDIFQKTKALTKEFKMTSPPQYHNFLVNIGLRKKGLCYHWADALYTYFTHQSYPSFEFHLMGANIGEYWTEHNVMVVVAKGNPVEEGVIIDPWREPGKLYFSKVKDDKRYTWVHRHARENFKKANRFCQ